MTTDVFAVPGMRIVRYIYLTKLIATVFFICFRECLETAIIISVLLSFLKQTLGAEGDRTVQKKLIKQVISPRHVIAQLTR